MPAAPNEAEIIFNKANLALAKSQRLIASWLPPPTPEEISNAKSEEELEKEEQEMFTPVPETLGLGAPLPKEVLDGDANRQELSSNDKLRKQLLGKDFRKLQAKSIGGRGGLSRSGVTQPGSKPRPINTERALDHDDKDEDEEGGRSSVGRSKRHRLDAVMTVGDEQEGIVAESKAPNEAFESTSSRSTKRSRSYLDQILQEKSHKKQKKKKQKEETSRQETV